MNQATEMRIVKGDREQIIELITTLVGLVIVYYAVNPNCFEELRTKLQEYRANLQHRISIWRAIRAIQTLPESDPL